MGWKDWFSSVVLRWAWSLLQVMPKSWVQQLSMVRGLQPSILILCRLVCYSVFTFAVLFSPIFGTSGVYAQTPTPTSAPTVTPTWESLFKTPTKIPTVVASCPTGQPQGWGTVTPDTRWLNTCQKCVTPIGRATWAATQTPIPSHTPKPATITATPSVTPTITPTIETYGGTWLSDMQTVSYWFSSGSGATKTTTMTTVANNQIVGVVWDVQSWSWTNLVQFRFIQDAATSVISITSDTGQQYCIGKYESAGHQYCQYWNGSYSTNNKVSNGSSNHFVIFHSGRFPGDQGSVSLNYWIIYKGVKPPAPTAVPGYCGVVSGRSGSTKEVTNIFNPRISPKSCTQIGGVSISTSWISTFTGYGGLVFPEGISVPAINFCTQEIQFGKLDMGFSEIDIDVLATAFGMISALFILMRS